MNISENKGLTNYIITRDTNAAQNIDLCPIHLVITAHTLKRKTDKTRNELQPERGHTSGSFWRHTTQGSELSDRIADIDKK